MARGRDHFTIELKKRKESSKDYIKCHSFRDVKMTEKKKIKKQTRRWYRQVRLRLNKRISCALLFFEQSICRITRKVCG